MYTAQYRNLTLFYHDQLEYETLIEEIFKERSYYADLDTNTPLIIDAGAHIGISTLYLHTLYPHARFICIEPNPQNLYYLEKNLHANLIENVTIIPKALVGSDGEEFARLFTDNQFTVFSSLHAGGWTGDQKGEHVQVQTIKLSEIIAEQTIDLLKMDIEGMETTVLKEASQSLSYVKHLLLEFHKTATNDSQAVLSILRTHYAELDVKVDKRKEKKSTNQLLFIEAKKRKIIGR